MASTEYKLYKIDGKELHRSVRRKTFAGRGRSVCTSVCLGLEKYTCLKILGHKMSIAIGWEKYTCLKGLIH
jgi:hypothetical protein